MTIASNECVKNKQKPTQAAKKGFKKLIESHKLEIVEPKPVKK